ncbi:MAG TPA: IS5/IS1182 family transposase, partial [Methanofollis liminatans]|nr:IS5/IS1182 family transposase [Methanofollis liminatans]
KARIFWYQIKEIKIKLILHNLTKAIQAILVLVVVEGFNKAE